MKIEKKVFEQEYHIGLTADEGKVIIYQSIVEGRKAEGYTTFCVDVPAEDFICAERCALCFLSSVDKGRGGWIRGHLFCGLNGFCELNGFFGVDGRMVKNEWNERSWAIIEKREG